MKWAKFLRTHLPLGQRYPFFGDCSDCGQIWVRVGLPAPHAVQVTESVREERIGEIFELHHGVSLASAGEDKRRCGGPVRFTRRCTVIVDDLQGDP